jgi:hypothetical protein
MQLTKSRVLSAITAGSLTFAVVAAITVGSGSGHTAQPAALTAQTESFPLVNLDDCPILHTGYPTGGCVAQLQTDLKFIQDSNLVVDGTFGSVGSQTYDAVITFQKANGLPQDGLVGPATKQALAANLSVPTPQPGAPLTPFEICQAQSPGLISDGHGGCTSDGTLPLGKSASDCLQEAIADKAAELIITKGLTAAAVPEATVQLAEKGSEIYDVGKVFKCVLLDNPNS